MDSDLEDRVKDLEAELARVQSVVQQLEQRLASLDPGSHRKSVVNDLSNKVRQSLNAEPGDNSPPAGPQI